MTWQLRLGPGPAAVDQISAGPGAADQVAAGPGAIDHGSLGQLATAGFAGFPVCAGASQRDCVVDGDTIRHGGVKIRLEDIDAPETFSPKCASEAALGRRATERLRDLMNAAPFQVVPSGGRDEDIYGRKLRVLMRDGRSLGDILVAEGLARPWDGARRGWCG